MNEKTARQIAEMKTQTIGVEVEMNNITRQKAAKVAATYFGTGREIRLPVFSPAPGLHRQRIQDGTQDSAEEPDRFLGFQERGCEP